ncbi:MAG: hypothetical protein EP346_09295, partial [Bacteroidetes bacterium]
MKKSILISSLVLGLSVLSFGQRRFTVLEVNGGISAIQGDLQDQIIGFKNVNPSFSVTMHTRASKSRSFSIGGGVELNTLNHFYSSPSRSYYDQTEVEGYHFNAQVSGRLLLTGRDDVRFMKGAFYTYLEGNAGMSYISVQSTYPPAETFSKLGEGVETHTEYKPSVGAALGFRYYLTYNLGVNLRLSGKYVASDLLDGVEGITDVNDYLNNI